jgi:hypothetical protein
MGSTCGFTNTYAEQCTSPDTAPDVVYRYTPSADECVNVVLCNSTSGTAFKVYVYAGDAGGCPQPPARETALDIACDDGGCPPYSRILNLTLHADVDYWIVVDGSNDACGEYRIDIDPCPEPECNTNEECDDGTFCNGVEFCGPDRRCHPGPLPFCDDGNPCTNDFCDPAEDACMHVRIPGCCLRDRDCQDGTLCNGVETCVDNTCQAGIPVDCSDGDPCTRDLCDPDLGKCEYEPIPRCCRVDADCEDVNPCAIPSCTENRCTYVNREAGTACGDPRDTACTDPDTCDGDGHCVPNHLPDGASCDDGDECTMNDVCLKGACVGTSDPKCATCTPVPAPLDPTQQLSFQALLVDAEGRPLGEAVDLDFQLYDLAGVAVGGPVHLPGVPVFDGIVSTAIPIDPGLLDGTGREVGVRVNSGEEMTPRIRLTSAPQAFRVGCVAADEMVDSLQLGDVGRSGVLKIFGPAGVRGTTATSLQRTAAPIVLDGSTGNMKAAGSIFIDSADSGSSSVLMTATAAPAGFCGQTKLQDNTDDTTVGLYACESHGGGLATTGGGGGELLLHESGGTLTIELDADTGDGPELSMFDDTGTVETVEILGSEFGSDGSQLLMRNAAGTTTVTLDAEATNGAGLRLYQDDYNPDSSRYDDDIGILLDGNYDAGYGGYGRMRVRNASGTTTIYIGGDYNGTGKGRIRTDILRIQGGSDLSEQFDIDTERGHVRPGMVVSIDPERPGRLTLSRRAYDRRVAGVISGAAGVEPGLLMGQSGTTADGDHPVALTGRVYCWADASNVPIEPGDMLTTSDVPGHAMKVTDYGKAHGAVIGKAMTGLSEGRGLVLVLVSLQ